MSCHSDARPLGRTLAYYEQWVIGFLIVPVLVSAYPSHLNRGGSASYHHPWTASTDTYSQRGFGNRTAASGEGDTYIGNIGSPYCSNIIEIPGNSAYLYQNVVKFNGSNDEPWTIVVWNKVGEDGLLDGQFGKGCQTFQLKAKEDHFLAFDDDSQGGFAAARGSSVPKSAGGYYASTWGEFDFASETNNQWSGADVSAIAAEDAGLPVQGMCICNARETGGCSQIYDNGTNVINAYNQNNRAIGGCGLNIAPGPVRLAVEIDYTG